MNNNPWAGFMAMQLGDPGDPNAAGPLAGLPINRQLSGGFSSMLPVTEDQMASTWQGGMPMPGGGHSSTNPIFMSRR